MPRIGIGLGLGHTTRRSSGGAASKYIVTPTTLSPTAGATDVTVAQLTDSAGIPVATSGLTVTWTKSDSRGSFSAATSVTDANGRATVTFTSSATAGVACTITATDTNAMTGTSSTITTALDASVFEYGAFEGWNDGGAGVPLNPDEVPTGTLAMFATPIPGDFSSIGGGAKQLTVNMTVIAKAPVTSAPDSVAAPTYYRLRSQDGASVLQCTDAGVVLDDTGVAIGDAITATITLTP